MKLTMVAITILFLYITINAQQLPNLPVKPAPKFEVNSFCPADGKVGSTDPELNKHKNRIDKAKKYYPVDFGEIQTLAYPTSVGGKVRGNWTTGEQSAVAQFEGIPVQVEGFLALVNNAHQGQPPLMQGARPEGAESCNCDSTQPDQIDFHLWLLNTAGDDRKNAIVVEMTPRVRSHHPKWTVDKLTEIANNQSRVRIKGWLMLDEQHPEQVGGTRATLWEIHPIIKIQYKKGNKWKTL